MGSFDAKFSRDIYIPREVNVKLPEAYVSKPFSLPANAVQEASFNAPVKPVRTPALERLTNFSKLLEAHEVSKLQNAFSVVKDNPYVSTLKITSPKVDLDLLAKKPVELQTSKFSIFRDTEPGRQVSTLAAYAFGAKKDGFVYSALGDYLPSNKDINNSKLYTTFLTTGPYVLARYGLGQQVGPAREMGKLIDSLHALRAESKLTGNNLKILSQIEGVAHKSAESSNTFAKYIVNSGSVSAAYGGGSNWVAGRDITFDSVFGSVLAGTFLFETGARIIPALKAKGWSDNAITAFMATYRSLGWGGYAYVASGGDVGVALATGAGGGVLTGLGPASNKIFSDKSLSNFDVVTQLLRKDFEWVAPVVGGVGLAKINADNKPMETLKNQRGLVLDSED